MNKFVLKIYDILSRHKALGITSFLAFTALLIALLLKLGYKEDISDFIPLDNERQNALGVYQDISGASKIIVTFENTDSVDTDFDYLATCVDAFVERIQERDSLGGVKDLVYKIDEENVSEITDFVYSNIAYFITDEDYKRLDSLLAQPDFVQNRLQQAKQMLMLPTGGLLTENLQRDPLNIFTPMVSELSGQGGSISMETYDGYILTPDMQKMILMMTSPFGNSETENNSKLLNLLSETKKELSEKNASLKISITGGPVIAVGNSTQIKIDSVISVLLAVVFILALLFYCIRSARNILLIVVSISWGWLFAIGGLALLHDKISIIVLGISSVILGIAVNYPLHLIAHLSHTTNVRTALKEITEPLLIGNITTVGAFCALIPLEAVALSDLGLFSAFLLIGTILFVVIYLPHILKKGKKETEERRDFFTKISELSINNNGYAFLIVIIITAVLGYFSTQTSFDSNISNVNYVDKEQRENMAYFQEITQGTTTGEQKLYIVSSDTTLDGALAKSNRINGVLKEIVSQNENARLSSCYRFVPSRKEQESRLNLWNDFVDKHSESLLTELHEQMRKNGFADGSFQEFEDILCEKRQGTLDDTLLKPLFMSNISPGVIDGQYSVVDAIMVDKDAVSDIKNAVETACPEQYCFDILSLNSSIAKNLSNNFDYIGWACGAIVFIFLWVSFGRLEIALLAFMPMVISWIWILGLMGLMGIQFNIVNVILATFIFGQGDDYTIFITEGCMYEYAYRKKMLSSYKKSIIISSLIMFIGIGSLIFAKHPALHSLAQVTIVGMLSVVMVSFIVPPLIFKWLVMKKGVYRKHPLTIASLLRTWYCGTIWILQVSVGYMIAGIMYLAGSRSLKSRKWFHKMVNLMHRIDLRMIPGVKFNLNNEHGEDFNKPSIIVCNHQSMLDPAYLLSLSSKILVVANEKSSLHPVVNGIFKWLNFYTVKKENHKDWVDHCFERDLALFEEYIKEGYSIAIFPEGMRNPNSNIVRYHKGPFYLAQKLCVDIVPIFIHGVNYIMPKGSFAMSSNPVTIVVGERITRENPMWNEDYAVMTKNVHQYYIKEYKKLCAKLETADYFAPLVKDRYLYKGNDVYSSVKKHLNKFGNYSDFIDREINSDKINIVGCGYGEMALLLALVHPELQVYAYDEDATMIEIARHSADGVANNVTFDIVSNLDDCEESFTIRLNEKGDIMR